MSTTNTIPEIEEIAPETELESAGDHIGEELVLLSAEFRDGTFGPYAAVRVTNADGEELVLSCGSETVLRQLHQVADKDGFPCRAVLVKVNNPRTNRQFMRFASPSKVRGLTEEGVMVDA